jgi:hypothetical protein
MPAFFMNAQHKAPKVRGLALGREIGYKLNV